MLNDQKIAIASLFNEALKNMGVAEAAVLLERPKVAAHGDLACNVAMQLARQLKKNPRQIATELIEQLKTADRRGLVVHQVVGPLP